jgi:hypothetical protein
MQITRASNLNIKQWVAILVPLVLSNNTNSLKERLVFFVSMAELSGKDTVDIEAAVEVFMASLSMFLETFDLRCI